ncbi:MAG TPA: mechanosensitive ion channel family protein [Clostridiaceae bacterium]|nr:mechanosensitive ion channel family protein [Clostridiaceae bacterium]
MILDKPFSVGDWIHTEKYEGTIEDITFRSTRIRTADNSVVTIPNSILSNEVIANWSKLEKRKIEISLRLPLETKAQELEILSKKFKIVLENNKDILEDSIQVDVNKIKEDNIEISIVLYTSITEYNKFLNIKQEININILKILEAEGIKLAYPGRNVYVQK